MLMAPSRSSQPQGRGWDEPQLRAGAVSVGKKPREGSEGHRVGGEEREWGARQEERGWGLDHS